MQNDSRPRSVEKSGACLADPLLVLPEAPRPQPLCGGFNENCSPAAYLPKVGWDATVVNLPVDPAESLCEHDLVNDTYWAWLAELLEEGCFDGLVLCSQSRLRDLQGPAALRGLGSTGTAIFDPVLQAVSLMFHRWAIECSS